MSFATDGDTDELAPGYLRRPISVAQLLEREGYQPVRSRTARRALSGVAAGAVLTLGAVVGSLFLGQRTTGDLESAGLAQSGGDIVLSETNTPAGHAPSRPAATTPTTSHTRTVHQPAATPVTHHSSPTTTHRTTTTTQPATTTTQSPAKATTQPTQHTATTQSTTQPTTTTPTTTTQPTTTEPTAQPTTPPTTPPSTTHPGNGGLLGGVGQILGGVTQPVFDWFN